MGVSELWSILDPVRQSVPLYSLSGKTLAVDLSLWVCEAQHVQGMMGKVTRPHLRNLFFRVSSLTLMGVKLVFVMEGDAPKLKAETMSKRTEMRYGAPKDKSVPKANKNTSRGRFKAVLRECAELLECLGVPWVSAAGEAEAMCAFLDAQGLVDGCITNDGDAFLYGAQTVYRNFNTTSKDPQVDCYQMSRVQAELSLSRETLVGLAVFLGCDYIPKGVAGVGREQTLKLIHSLKGESLLQKFSEWRSGRGERSEVTVKKVTHCLVCRHPGSAKSHERSGCVFCHSERFCSPHDYDSQCPCEWHRTEDSRQASSVEANIRKKTLACEQFPFTEIIAEFLVTKDKPVQAFRRRKPNLQLMQAFALQKMDWPKHYSSEKLLTLMTYTELMNRKHKRDTQPQIQPIRIYKPRVRNSVSCFEVIWKKPDGFVFPEGSEDQAEVRTLEESSLFALAFPLIVHDFNQEREKVQETKTKRKKPKAKPIDSQDGCPVESDVTEKKWKAKPDESQDGCHVKSDVKEKKPKVKDVKEKKARAKPVDSHDAVSDLFAQMSLQTDTDTDVGSSQNPPPSNEIRPQSPASQNCLSVSALIGQLHLSCIDWDSSSFTSSPSQNTDPRPALITDHRPAKNADPRPVKNADPRPAQNTDHRSAQNTDHRPALITDHRPAQNTHPRPAKNADPRPAQNTDHRPAQNTHPRPAQNQTYSLKDGPKTQAVGAKSKTMINPERRPESVPGQRKPSENSKTVCKTSPVSDDSDEENRPRSQRPRNRVKVTSRPEKLPNPDQMSIKSAKTDSFRPQKTPNVDQISVTTAKTDSFRPQKSNPDLMSVKQAKIDSFKPQKSPNPDPTSDRLAEIDSFRPQKTPSPDQISVKPVKTPEKDPQAVLRSGPVHHGNSESEDSDASLDSPRPLAERLKLRFAK